MTTTTSKRHISGPGRRRKLSYGHYNHIDKALELKARALPPRDLFAGQPDILAAYDKVTTLIAAEAEQTRLAASKRAEADVAGAKHDDAVRAALVGGKDPAKVKATAEQLRAEATKASEFADLAARQLVHALRDLGAAIRLVAADLFAPAEADLAAAGERIGSLLDDLSDEWQRYAAAWRSRVWLSQVAMVGGAAHWNAGRVPAAVTEGIATMRQSVVSDLPTLIADEGAVIDWRAEQTQAAWSNQSGTAADAGAAHYA